LKEQNNNNENIQEKWNNKLDSNNQRNENTLSDSKKENEKLNKIQSMAIVGNKVSKISKLSNYQTGNELGNRDEEISFNPQPKRLSIKIESTGDVEKDISNGVKEMKSKPQNTANPVKRNYI